MQKTGSDNDRQRKLVERRKQQKVIKCSTRHFNLIGVPEKIKSDRGEAFISDKKEEFRKSWNK